MVSKALAVAQSIAPLARAAPLAYDARAVTDDRTRPQVEIQIDSIAAGGEGVGRDDDGRVTFVSHAAPGDRVRADVVREHRRYARAELTEVTQPSAVRVEPPCPLFANATCGGCQLQHLDAGAQAEAKAAIVAGALRRHVAQGMELRPIQTPVSPYRWRRRARFHWFRPRGAKGAIIGFFAPRTHRVTDVERCPQIEDSLEQALAVLRTDLAPALGRRGEILAVSGHRGDVHLSIHGNADAGVVANLVGRGPITGVRLGKQRIGEQGVELEPGALGQADDFAQASRDGNVALVRAVTGAASPVSGSRVLELYAGTGNFTRALASAGAEVVAVERARPPELIPPGVDWRRLPAERALADLVGTGHAFDLAVLDPPRTGAREVVPALLELAPARILYVSCDPATLARDLDALAEGGYEPTWARPMDLMPQTAHVEIVAEARRLGAELSPRG